MLKQNRCQSCEQRHNCREIYQQLGKIESPSVIPKVLVAFLLPLVVFIAALAVFEGILANSTDTRELQTAVNFLLALLVTFAFTLIIRAIKSPPPNKLGCQTQQHGILYEN